MRLGSTPLQQSGIPAWLRQRGAVRVTLLLLGAQPVGFGVSWLCYTRRGVAPGGGGTSHVVVLTPKPQVEEDNREILRLLRDSGTAEKLEGLKRLIAQSEWQARRVRTQRVGRRGRARVCVRTHAWVSLHLTPPTRAPVASVRRT